MTVRDHTMIAHSLRGEVFEPAQPLHGATYVVVDIGRAAEVGAGARNLDGLVVTLRKSHIAWASYERPL